MFDDAKLAAIADDGDVGTGKTILMDAATLAARSRDGPHHGPEVRASDITPRRQDYRRNPSAG